MKIRIYSDMHLDHYVEAFHQTRWIDPKNPSASEIPRLWYPLPMPDDKETTLILAGDLWTGTSFIHHGEDSWISNVAQHFKQVLIVLGNHDYWPCNKALTIRDGGKKCNDLLEFQGLYNVKVLDCDTYQDGDVLFVGATLWTDMNKSDPLAMYNMPRFMTADGKCAFETGVGGAWSRFTSEKWVGTHQRHRDYIKHVVEQNRDKKVVVITHHIPLMHVGDPIYANNAANAYYMSDLSDLFIDNDNLKLWCCGHSHIHNDLMFENTRFYMNPLGYQGEHREQQGFVKHEILEI